MTPSTTWRRAAGPAAAATLVGIALILLIAQRIATGAAIFFAGCLGFTLLLIRDWLAEHTRRITDTTAERARLAEAEAAAHAAAAQADASHAANVVLRDRLLARAAEDAARTQQYADDAIAAARQKADESVASARQEFEDDRARTIVEAYETGAMNERNGRHNPGEPMPIAELINLAERRRTPPSSAASGHDITRP